MKECNVFQMKTQANDMTLKWPMLGVLDSPSLYFQDPQNLTFDFTFMQTNMISSLVVSVHIGFVLSVTDVSTLSSGLLHEWDTLAWTNFISGKSRRWLDLNWHVN